MRRCVVEFDARDVALEQMNLRELGGEGRNAVIRDLRGCQFERRCGCMCTSITFACPGFMSLDAAFIKRRMRRERNEGSCVQVRSEISTTDLHQDHTIH